MNRLILLSCWTLATLLGNNAVANSPDWLFARGNFTHSPRTGARTAQFAAVAPVEGLPDPRATMSRYWNTRTQIVGADGSSDTIYEVHSFGDAQGVNNARWERDFDAWKEAAHIAGPFWAGAYWPSGGGPPAPGANYYNQGYGTGGGYGYGYGGGGPYTGYGPNGYFGGPNVPFGVSPYGYGNSPRYRVYHHGRPRHGGGGGHGHGDHERGDHGRGDHGRGDHGRGDHGRGGDHD